jgi:preprotein translocase subunit SecD
MPAALQDPFTVWLLLTAALAGLAYVGLRPELRVRGILYGSVLVACLVSAWPPYGRNGQPGKIKLGLDLKGGIHLVLQVVTDDALVASVDDTVQSVRDKLTHQGIAFAGVQRLDPTSLSIEGVEAVRVKDVRDLLSDYKRDDWAIQEPAEGRFILKMSEAKIRRLRDSTVQEAIRTLERRVNQLGVAEPVIGEYGNRGDQILVQLPGVTDVDQAKRVLQQTAQLSLKLVEDDAPTREALLQNFQGKVPENMEVLPGQADARVGESGQRFYLVRREVVITGRDMKTARAAVGSNNEPDVHFSLNAQGAERFRRFTGQNIGRRLAIIMDGSVVSAPVINSQISSEGEITGRFTTQEADELSKVLRAGALPATLKIQQELTVGASLGRDSIRAGVTASAAGMLFLAVFMLVYYRLSGLNAIVALSVNLLILLGAMAYFGATLTLPGIAGIILTIGVGVDTNVLVFERIREEIRNGKTVKAAVTNGFDRVWITIIDTHVTALIAAAFLYQFGTGPIKGFAVTLSWGLMANVFASFFVSRFLFEWILGKRQVATLSI